MAPRFDRKEFGYRPNRGSAIVTMGIDDAIIASNFVKCNKIVGCHYDTFDPIKIDKDAASKKFSDAGKELILLNIGESKNI